MMEISEEAVSTILETLAEMREMNKDLTHLRETAEDKALELMNENQELLKENHDLCEENHKLAVENAVLRGKLEGEGEDE